MEATVIVWKIVAGILASLGGGGLIVLALSGWLGKVWAARILERDRLHYTTELERFKTELDRSTRQLQANVDRTVFVGRVHFETEFKALADIWSKVAAMRASMAVVRPMSDIVPANENPEQREERQVSRLRAFLSDLDQFVTAVDSQSPFIPERIFRKLEEIVVLARREAIEVRVERQDRERNPLRDWHQRGREHNQQLERLTAELSDLIRERLASLVVLSSGGIS